MKQDIHVGWSSMHCAFILRLSAALQRCCKMNAPIKVMGTRCSHWSDNELLLQTTSRNCLSMFAIKCPLVYLDQSAAATSAAAAGKEDVRRESCWSFHFSRIGSIL